MTYYIYSTATCGAWYTLYEENSSKDIAMPKKVNGKICQVEIKGGHGVATKHLVTPRGVVTKVSDEEFELLQQNKSFQKHVQDGFLSFDKKEIAPEKKAADMADKDGSAPITPQDFEEGENSSDSAKTYKKRKGQN